MAASWKVDGQRQSSQFQAGGSFVDGQTVTFTTGDGHTGQVFVPASILANKGQVAAMIQAKADALDAIGALSSDELSSGNTTSS